MREVTPDYPQREPTLVDAIKATIGSRKLSGQSNGQMHGEHSMLQVPDRRLAKSYSGCKKCAHSIKSLPRNGLGQPLHPHRLAETRYTQRGYLTLYSSRDVISYYRLLQNLIGHCTTSDL